MNKIGQLAFVGGMIAFMIIILITVFIEPLKDQAATASAALDCDNASLSAGEAGTCIVTDSYLISFIGMGLGVALAWFGARRIGGIES